MATPYSSQSVQEILRQIFPSTVVEKLMRNEEVKPDFFPDCTILFSDIVGYTTIASYLEPIQAHELLHSMYIVLDYCLSYFPLLYKVETIGDAFMVIGGAPINTCDTILEMTQFAILINHIVPRVVVNPVDRRPISIRIGMHTGDVVGGIVGSIMPRYTFSGDCVNVAARMQTLSETDGIMVSDITALHIARRFAQLGTGDIGLIELITKQNCSDKQLIFAGMKFRFDKVFLVSAGLQHVKGKGNKYTFLLKRHLGAEFNVALPLQGFHSSVPKLVSTLDNASIPSGVASSPKGIVRMGRIVADDTYLPRQSLSTKEKVMKIFEKDEVKFMLPSVLVDPTFAPENDLEVDSPAVDGSFVSRRRIIDQFLHSNAEIHSRDQLKDLSIVVVEDSAIQSRLVCKQLRAINTSWKVKSVWPAVQNYLHCSN